MHPQDVLRKARLLLSASEIELALKRMAERITADLASRQPVVIAVMNGGAFTAVNLCRHFQFAYEFDYVHATRYDDSNEGGALQWRVRPDARLAGRTVLLVDDVLDKGETLAALHDEFSKIGAHEVFTAVLVKKNLVEASPRPHVDYAAVETDDVYLFGCGMDYSGYWRGLPELYASDHE